MFEQVSVDSQGLLKRPLAMTVSLAGQVTALIAVAVVSLAHIDSLPPGLVFLRVVAPGRPTAPAPPHPGVSVRSVRTAAKLPWRPFTQPSRVPSQIALTDASTLIPDGVGIESGVPGGIGEPSDYSLMRLIDLPHPPALAPAKPVPQEKPAVSVPPKPIAVSKGVQAAKLIRQIKPIYPPLARQARISGTVRLTAIIGRDGAIEHLQLISGHPLLAPSAIDAVRQWLYQPTLLSGEPVEVVTQIDVNFAVSP